MVDPVVHAGVADTLEARLADARKRHADGEYGTIPLLIVELGIRSQWATEHPSRPVSPRPVRNEGGVDDEVDGGAQINGNNGMKRRGVIKVDDGVDRSQARVQRSTATAGSSRADDDGRRRSPLQSGGGLSAASHVMAGGIAPTYGHFKFSPDRIAIAPLQGRRDLITWRESIEPQLELEEKMTHIRMGEQESATDYCSRARQTLAEMRMAGAEYSTSSYISHLVKGLPRGYNLMKRMMMVPGTRESLDKDSITCYILQDEAMQEAEQPTELLPWANYAAPTKLNQQQGQHRKPRGGGSGSGRSMKDVDERRSTRDKGRGVEPMVSLASEAGEDFQAVAAAVQANPMAVLLDSGCSHHLMGTKAVFIDMAPSDGMKHVRGFNGALQPLEGRGTVALQGAAGKRVLVPDVLYVPGVQANLLSAGQQKESGVQLKGDGDEMLLITATGGVLGRARYTKRVLCTDLRPFSMRSQSTEVVALCTIVSATKSTPDRLHARLAHVSVDTIKSSAQHEVATGLDITSSIGTDPPCVSCIGGKLAEHTFPDKGSNAEEALAVVHIDLCGPFRVAAKDGSLYFLLLKDRHTRFVWVMPVAKKSDVLQEFQKWLVLVERQTKKSVLALHSDRGGEFLRKDFTDFVICKGIVHDLTCPYTPQQNGMAEREMRTAVESVRTMLLHMGVQHHWWHLALRQAVWVRNYLEQSTMPPGTTPYQLLTRKKPDLTLARVWGCMVQFMAKLGPASGRTQAHPPTDTTTATVPLLAEVDEPADEDVVEVLPPTLVLAPPFPVADRPSSTPVSATGDEGSLEALLVALASGIAGSQQNAKLDDRGAADTGPGGKQLVDDLAIDEEGELLAGEESTNSDVVEVPITKPELRRTGQTQRPPEQLSFHTCLPPAAFTTVYDEVDDDLLYDDAKEDEELPELDPDVHADPEHRWDIATMTVKEALASWKGEAVRAAMEEEIRSLTDMGTWELVERPRGVNIMKNRWVLTTKYRIDDTVKREKARLVIKGFTQVCGADYDETYSPGLLEAAFQLREISPIVKYLGLEIVRDRPARKLWLHQQGYADKLRRRCIDEEQGSRVPKTPVSVDAYSELTYDDEDAQEREEEGYRQMVGSLQFAATTTRPDIAFAFSKLGSGLTVRSDQHWREVDHCLAYLADTRDTALEFGGGPESLELIGYVDADDAGNKQNRTSMGGYVLVYGGAAISWSNSRIKCVTLSSTESEYMAATDACKEGRRLRFLLVEFKLLDAGKPTILRVDNKSAITVTEGLGLTSNLKHMERRYAWLQHMVRHGKFVLRYIPTTKQPADFLTKALHFPAFNRCSVAIGQVTVAKATSGWYLDVDVARRAQKTANGASQDNHLRAPASVRTAVFYGATLDSRSTAALAHRRPAALAGRLSAVLARLIYATLAGGRPCCAVSRQG
ncbi:unnamed protein product [Closterium sp. NIES-53]